MEIIPTGAQRSQCEHSSVSEAELHTVLAGELRREVRLDALPPLLELEDTFALLLEALSRSRRAGDLDPDLQLLLLIWLRVGIWLDGRGFMSFAQVALVHAAGRAGEGRTAVLRAGYQWKKGVHAFVRVPSGGSVCRHCSSGAVICGPASCQGAAEMER